ncbi:MAG TPA: hypothetical protein VN901_23485 [Candidatus Acidoferrales bacterium]|nr:hypothetical protein [Candidatus Acidoferrales bacterium]
MRVALEGKYVIQTEEQNLSAPEVVARYKELNEVERGFAHLKGLAGVASDLSPQR